MINDKLFTLTSSSEINDICKPFFKGTDLNYFHYCKFYQDFSSTVLVTNPHWVTHVLKNKLYISSNSELKDGFFLWSEHWPQAAKDASLHFKIHNLMSLVKTSKNEVECISFGSTQEGNKAIEFYLNNSELLKSFIYYFKDKAQKHLSIAQMPENKIVYPPHKEVKTNLSRTSKVLQQTITLESPIQIDKFPINDGKSTKWLSRREIEVLISTIKGRSAKEIARSLDISTKTVESYIASAKLKLDCYSRSALIEKAISLGFLDLMKHFNC